MRVAPDNPDQIDIVYLWVDGSDAVWQKKRQRAYRAWSERNPNELAVFGNAAGRFRDNGELLFNLRALERFFPDHGHVYIVTDGQVPHWLQPSRRITVVDHGALIPPSAGAVFDSGNIESYLHRIPGLSERYLYLNDDVFFGATVDPAWWFGSRLKVFAQSDKVPGFACLQPQETALVNASILSKNWMTRRYPEYRHDPRVYSHAPRPMLKSAMQELEALAPELFAHVRSTAFRSWRSPPLVSDLVPRWMVHTGYAEQIVLDPLHISTGDRMARQQLDTLRGRFGRLPFFCLNDTCDEAPDDDPRLLRVTRTLDTLLPEPSSFEHMVEDSEAA